MKTCRIFAGILLVVFFTSCINTRRSVYFASQPDSASIVTRAPQPSAIENNDILSIAVVTANPASAAVFNAPNQTATTVSTATGSQLQASGYLVDVDGNIQFPVIGNIKAKGLTTMQLRNQLTKTLTDRKLLVDPVVTVRQLTFKVSVLGEVGHAGVITVPDEQITLLEALGLAGDITIYGRKDNVMVIRQENSKKTIQRLNLNSDELFASPYYYLKSNDVVYVESGKSRVFAASRASQVIPITIGVLSIAAIILARVLRKN